MRKFVLWAALAACAAVAAPAFAQTPTCQGDNRSRREAKPIDTSTPSGMASVIMLGAMFPQDDGRGISREIKCAYGPVVDFGQLKFTLTDGDAPPRLRRFVPNIADAPMLYLEAILELDGLTNGGSKTPKFALVSVGKGGVAAWRLYEGMPSDALLRIDLAQIVAGRISPIVARKAGTKDLEIDPGTPEQRSEPWTGKNPDGKVFERERGGAARHALTGFICPAKVAGFDRTDLMAFDGLKGGKDVACRYGAERDAATWLTFYLTELQGMSQDEVFKGYVQSAQDATGGPGTKVESPIAVGAPPQPANAAFWKSAAGPFEGLALSSIGDWRIKIRVTYAAGKEADVAAAADALYKAAYDQVKPRR